MVLQQTVSPVQVSWWVDPYLYCRLKACPVVDSLCGRVISVYSLKASKEAGQALVYKVNPNFEVLHHHLLHCLEKTTVRTHTHTLSFLNSKISKCKSQSNTHG